MISDHEITKSPVNPISFYRLGGPPGAVDAGAVVTEGDAVVGPGKHDVWEPIAAPGLASDGSENTVGGGSENVGDVVLAVGGGDAVEPLGELEGFTANGFALPEVAGMVAPLGVTPTTLLVGGGKTVVLGGVGPDVGSAPVVTGIQDPTADWLGVTIGPCVIGPCACALTATAEHAAIMIR